eukprot:gnl/TRDRNA2_/TRDRNA2_94153_c0_seq2.p1 gnl/TRDRNA2_/TRDRNA2_94153_c0~~gnl/TRDRNA2_/TRDRNA2_94153_c0_seq2.p1  ORF type:complete len:193 (+),score=32.13 gnl/TRDRNA2_/TRDRNA2_94153_c0_seq2:54-581(+)
MAAAPCDAHQAVAGDDRPNFTGNWIMDLTESDSLSSLLTELGFGMLSRGMIGSMTVWQEIKQTEELVDVKVTTWFGSDSLRLACDGRVEQNPGILGEKTASVTRWVKNGLETRQLLDASQAIDDPHADVFVTTRSLCPSTSKDSSRAEDRLLEYCEILRNGKSRGTARRILRRQS